MTSRDDIDSVIDAIKAHDNFIISAHVNPEGDSIGSQIAISRMLEQLGKKSAMADHDSVPENLRFLEGSSAVSKELPQGFIPRTAIVVDCPVLERTGDICELIKKTDLIINIDHHVSNNYFGDVNWVDSKASSVGEMMFRLASRLGVKIDSKIATAIYVAILTDTGMFNYSNTSEGTHKVAAELIALGVNPRVIHSKIFESKPLHDVRLLGKTLATLKTDEDGKIAYITLTRDMCQEEKIEVISTDEFINYPRSIKGVEVAVFFKESLKHGKTVNASFRSTGKVDVNAIASHFGGGGHTLASGCVLDCGLEEAKKLILEEVKRVLTKTLGTK